MHKVLTLERVMNLEDFGTEVLYSLEVIPYAFYGFIK